MAPLAYLRIVRSIASAWGFVESRNSVQISVIPPGGKPILRSATIANKAPAHAPRFPSQYSGFGSNLIKIQIKLL